MESLEKVDILLKKDIEQFVLQEKKVAKSFEWFVIFIWFSCQLVMSNSCDWIRSIWAINYISGKKEYCKNHQFFFFLPWIHSHYTQKMKKDKKFCCLSRFYYKKKIRQLKKFVFILVSFFCCNYRPTTKKNACLIVNSQ